MVSVILSSRVRGVVRLSVERVKEPTVPRALGLEKACQGNPSNVPALLFLHLSDLENPYY